MPIPTFANNLRVNLGAGTQLARLGFGIELEKAEAQVPAFIPFKVVGQAPVKVATQVGAFLEQRANLICGGLQDPGANTIGAIGDAVFQNVDRLLEAGESFHGAAQAFGIGFAVRDLDAGIALRLVWRHGQPEKQSLRTGGRQPCAQAAVIIDAHVVAGALHLLQAVAKLVEWERRLAGLDAASKVLVEAPIDEPADPTVDSPPRATRFEDHEMLGPADVGVRLQGVN